MAKTGTAKGADMNETTTTQIKCLDCSHPLTSAKSQTRQRGPLCHARHIAALALAAAFKNPQAAAEKALQIIADRAIVRTRVKGQYLTVSSDGSQNYLTDVVENSCTCEAGHRHGRCSHLLAANVKEITATRKTAVYALAA